MLLLGNTPRLHELIRSGSHTFWAKTTELSVTLPSHTSMLTGVTPDRHGITWNSESHATEYPRFPTIFEIAKRSGITCALVAGKVKFNCLTKAGTIDWESIAASDDADVARRALEMIHDHHPRLLFVHLPGVDHAGHAKGWGSPEQFAAVEQADAAFAAVVDAFRADAAAAPFIIVTANHGGQGLAHGPNDPRSRTIPWIAAGPGIRTNYDLTRQAALNVNTEDTFATTCAMLGLKPDPGLDGKPVAQILVPAENLMHEVPADSAK